jgi:Ca2+-binding EF-hand superfamily protein
MDADRSGVVDKSEIVESLKKERGGQAPSAEDVDGMLAMLDMDGDGKVTFVEYVTALAS